MTANKSPIWHSGFVLTTSVKRSSKGDCVELWLVTPKGSEVIVTSPQDYVVFARQADRDATQRLTQDLNVQFFDSHLRTFNHEPVVVIKSAKQRAFKQLSERCVHEGIPLFESDIKLTDRFLMERFIYGSIDFTSGEIPTTRSGQFKPALRYVSFDIECDETGTLYSIGCDYAGEATVWMIDPHRQPQNDPNFTYVAVQDERQLLQAWCAFIRDTDPDVLVGWNVKQFDCSVLVTRAAQLGVILSIGRDGSAMQVRQGASEQVWVEIAGRAVVDGIESLKTMTIMFDNFSLENVGQKLLGRGKLVHEADQLSAIKTLFKTDKLRLASYNFQDCRLVSDIVEHTQMMDYLVLRSCLTGLSVSRPGGSVAAFINSYLPHVHRAGYIAPNRPADGGLASPGGYVMTSTPGLFEHVVLLDFKSLYPSIIRTFLIDPVGLVEGLKAPENAIPGFKDAAFSRDTHFLPAIIDHLWSQREQAKAAGDEPRSRAIKIIMNSFYGVLGSGGCPFYDTRLASSITLRGHEIMQRTKQKIESLGYAVIYGDTDSTFVWLQDCKSDSEAITIGNELATTINEFWQDIIEKEFSTQCFLEIEFETHFSRFFMPTIRNSEMGSKKRYVGKPSPQFGDTLIFKGMESVRSDWTELARSFQTELYCRIFRQQPVNEFIRQTVEEVLNQQRDRELIYRKQLKKPVESYTKTRPPQVKAAAIANQLASDRNLPIPYTAKTYVEYVITRSGPQPVSAATQIDYAHYVDKQLKPIADSILPHLGTSFDQIVTGQLSLF